MSFINQSEQFVFNTFNSIKQDVNNQINQAEQLINPLEKQLTGSDTLPVVKIFLAFIIGFFIMKIFLKWRS